MVMSHPGVGLDKCEDLTKSPAFIAKEARPSTSGW